MAHPLVVHCQRAPYDVYIGRAVARKRLKASRWANPYKVPQDGTRAEVIALYRAWLLDQPQLLAELHTLHGKVLGCWCAPKACHGEVLVELAARVGLPRP
jgi:hypothetical protein